MSAQPPQAAQKKRTFPNRRFDSGKFDTPGDRVVAARVPSLLPKPGWCMLRKNFGRGGLIGIKTCLAGLCLAVLAATVMDVPPVEAQTKKKQNGPRARITVEPRSFLDAGTEVLPGERSSPVTPRYIRPSSPQRRGGSSRLIII